MSFWAITSYFNPCGYPGKLERFRQFAEGVRSQGCKLLVVECGTGTPGEPYEVKESDADILIHSYSRSVLWQKERLQGMGVIYLPADCAEFGWLDADILFENDDWVKDTERRLRYSRIVQPFGKVFSHGVYEPGMAYSQIRNADRHIIAGHPGYAWAARRENFPGFYDRAIVGGGDNILGWAIYGHAGLWPGYGRAASYFSPAQLKDITEWSARFHAAMQGKVSFVEGIITHLDHGSKENRQYLERLMIPKENDFEPSDIRASVYGAWEWATAKPRMHEQIRDYFYSRKEAA